MHVKPETVRIVTDAQQLDELCSHLREAGSFAFDTEFVMEETYEPVVGLLQVATESIVALTDPMAGLDAAPLWALVSDASIQKIVHAGLEDLALCRRLTGAAAANVFDVQIAAGLVGLDYPLRLSRLVEALLGVRIHKAHTLSDWRIRPLRPEQINYAAEDVCYLPACHQALAKRLKRLGRGSWAQEEFDRLVVTSAADREAPRNVSRIKGAGSLDALGQTIARELANVRDALARRFNRPPRALLKDHLLIEIARRKWTTVEQIRSLRGLQLKTESVRQLADAVQRAKALPHHDRPVLPAPDDDRPEESVLCSLLSAVIRDYCINNGVAYGLTASSQHIRDYVRHCLRGGSEDSSPLAAGWRHEAVGGLLDELLSGKRGVRVERSGKTCRLDLA